jgi:hypothetical protein
MYHMSFASQKMYVLSLVPGDYDLYLFTPEMHELCLFQETCPLFQEMYDLDRHIRLIQNAIKAKASPLKVRYCS